jgi:hypothetical protein
LINTGAQPGSGDPDGLRWGWETGNFRFYRFLPVCRSNNRASFAQAKGECLLSYQDMLVAVGGSGYMYAFCVLEISMMTYLSMVLRM